MQDRIPISERCVGRWRSIMAALGVDQKFLNTRKHGPCFFCGGTDRYRWTNFQDGGGFFCSKCGSGSGVDMVMKYFGLEFIEAVKKIEGVIGVSREDKQPAADKVKQRDAARAVWERGVAINADDPVGLYLANRRINLSPYPNCLRYVPSLRYSEDGSAPAMIAKITAPDGTTANIHRTWLTKDGKKAPIEPCRKVMAGEIPSGSAIRFWPPASIMGIAEGIETALRASEIFKIPVWSVVNEGGMQKFRPPEIVTELTIFGDCDHSFTGQAAAYIAAKEILVHRQKLKQDISIKVEIPKILGTDWADKENDLTPSPRKPEGAML